MGIEKEAYYSAIKVLEKCSTKHGFYAAYPGYDMVFARDSMIISLGASLINKKFKNTFKNSLITLSKNQSKKGQIANAVDKHSRRNSHVDYKSIDSSIWFVIGHYLYKKRYKDSSLFKKQKKNIQDALTWLSYQDMGEDGMLEQLPTTDWQDAFPHRYGHTINTQALYYKVLNLTGNKKEAKRLKEATNKNKDVALWDRSFYLPWRWKNHGEYKEMGKWFDTLGNLLAIIYGLADETKSKKILDYIKKKKIDKPYPIHASVWPPIRKGTKDWRDYFNDNDARTPYHYINSGIWTYVGGFYVLALIKIKKFKEAEVQLKKLAEINLKGNFSEWYDGKTAKPVENGENQGWNAGMYIVAYESLKKKRVLI